MAVEFNQEKEFNQLYETSSNSGSGLANWIIKVGIAKDENGANIAMIIVAIISFALTIYFLTH
jgi:hypothetical protein